MIYRFIETITALFEMEISIEDPRARHAITEKKKTKTKQRYSENHEKKNENKNEKKFCTANKSCKFVYKNKDPTRHPGQSGLSLWLE